MMIGARVGVGEESCPAAGRCRGPASGPYLGLAAGPYLDPATGPYVGPYLGPATGPYLGLVLYSLDRVLVYHVTEWCSDVCAVTAMVYWARHAKRVNFAKGSYGIWLLEA